MRDVAIVSYEQTLAVRDAGSKNDVELLMPVIEKTLSNIGFSRRDVDFTCSGSCDYLGGAAFAFVGAVDALGAVPPIKESHVEMDAAWALYEAWIKIQTGEIDTALVYGFGKSSSCDLPHVLSLQCDPYMVQPLWPDSISLAALQAQALLNSGRYTEEDFAKVAQDSRRKAQHNPYAQLKGEFEIADLLAADYQVQPLRKHDCAPISDGASAMLIAAKNKLPAQCKKPVWISGLDHRIDMHNLGLRDLCDSPSTRIAAEKAGVYDKALDFAELYAPFSSQQLILKDALRLSDKVDINPSGGALAAHVFMACGLDRIGAAYRHIEQGKALRGLAHATSGPCLQQNLITVLEA